MGGIDQEQLTAEEKDAVLGRIKTSVSLQDMAAADFVVEAATENETIKNQIFKDLDEICEMH